MTYQIRDLHTAEQMQTAAALLESIWLPEGQGDAPVEAGLLVALEHAGNYVSGAFAGEQMVGATVGFFGAPDPQTGRSQLMHSHIAGVLPGFAGRGIGAAMKQHQRSWCLQRGVRLMEWTFDPLIARNARFNLHKLGAALTEYLPDFYGEMRDGINAGQGSDRALVSWDLASPRLGAEIDAVPAPQHTLLDITDEAAPFAPARGEDAVTAAAEAELVALRIPRDIEVLRKVHPQLAAQWRSALRETMHPLLKTGWTVAGIRREGSYLLCAPAAHRRR
ncbi:hypothetical protein [Nesterenkonia ebinurensis]|uniref:hypothetical protein n=1 Tax=Nesterenkonia ebinurensis TaxID=2608252 RepID=UPI00123DE5BD|nr:hypothetical protein [Nesterenkonia ebinurensis]